MKVSVVEAGGLEDEAGCEAGPTVARHLHRAVLLDPELAHDHVVHAAVHVAPRVRLTPSTYTILSRLSAKYDQ